MAAKSGLDGMRHTCKLMPQSNPGIASHLTNTNVCLSIGSLPDAVFAQPLVYMSLHIFLTAATFAVAKIWWSFYGAHTAFLLACLAVSAWNGASYYFDVFAHRYVAGLDTLLQVRGLPCCCCAVLRRAAVRVTPQNIGSHQDEPLNAVR